MKSNFESFDIRIFGESHTAEIGVEIDGFPAGATFAEAEVRAMLDRRRSGANVWSTPRKENDEAEFFGGVECADGIFRLTGEPFSARIKNGNVRPSDYDVIKSVPRPSHADYVAFVRDGYIPSGGGEFSGRMTAPLCVAGAVAESLLAVRGISVCAYIASVGKIDTGSYRSCGVAVSGLDEKQIAALKSDSFPVLDPTKRQVAVDEIAACAKDGDSVGGVVECVVSGLKAAEIGGALFRGIEGEIASAVFAVPAVKGIEFGSGFYLTAQNGSKANDEFCVQNGKIGTLTNQNGGINGGICNGMPITLRVAVKPTPSIGKPQRSVNLLSMTEETLEIRGRHDACIVPRAVPCVESAVALAVLDMCLSAEKKDNTKRT